MRRIVIVWGILVILFALGAFAQGYAQGYEDGKAAVMKVAHNADFLSRMGGIFSTVPTELIEGIEDMPESYQEGYVMGYKDNALTASMQPGPGMFNFWLVTAIICIVCIGAVSFLIMSA